MQFSLMVCTVCVPHTRFQEHIDDVFELGKTGRDPNLNKSRQTIWKARYSQRKMDVDWCVHMRASGCTAHEPCLRHMCFGCRHVKEAHKHCSKCMTSFLS